MSKLTLRWRSLVVAALVLSPWTVSLQAQESSAPPAEEQEGEASAANQSSFQNIDEMLEAENEILAGSGYSYDPAGRRDPFKSLLVAADKRAIEGPTRRASRAC